MWTPSFMQVSFQQEGFRCRRESACLRVGRASAAARTACGGHSLCEIATATRQLDRAVCASRSTACRSPRARRCSPACAATSGSSAAPTSTATAAYARCSRRIAAAGAPTSSRSRKSWDRFARAGGEQPAATEREVRILDHPARREPRRDGRAGARRGDRRAPRRCAAALRRARSRLDEPIRRVRSLARAPARRSSPRRPVAARSAPGDLRLRGRASRGRHAATEPRERRAGRLAR